MVVSFAAYHSAEFLKSPAFTLEHIGFDRIYAVPQACSILALNMRVHVHLFAGIDMYTSSSPH